jgi:protein-disulfide isomerase
MKLKGAASVAATTITLIILALTMLFFWQVYGYYRQIKSNDTAAPPKSPKFSFSSKLPSAPAAAPRDTQATADDPSVGPADSPLVIVEFLDYECPYCQAMSGTVRAMTIKYGDRVRFVIRDIPLTDIHPQALQAAEAAGCAEAQGKFWPMHDRLFANQADLTIPNLKRLAAQVGLDAGVFDVCMDTHARVKEIEADLNAGVAAGVRGTPTFFVNGEKIEGVIPADVFETVIKDSLEKPAL